MAKSKTSNQIQECKVAELEDEKEERRVKLRSLPIWKFKHGLQLGVTSVEGAFGTLINNRSHFAVIKSYSDSMFNKILNDSSVLEDTYAWRQMKISEVSPRLIFEDLRLQRKYRVGDFVCGLLWDVSNYLSSREAPVIDKIVTMLSRQFRNYSLLGIEVVFFEINVFPKCRKTLEHIVLSLIHIARGWNVKGRTCTLVLKFSLYDGETAGEALSWFKNLLRSCGGERCVRVGLVLPKTLLNNDNWANLKDWLDERPVCVFIDPKIFEERFNKKWDSEPFLPPKIRSLLLNFMEVGAMFVMRDFRVSQFGARGYANYLANIWEEHSLLFNLAS